MSIYIEDDLQFKTKNVIRNPDHDWFRETLKPYYVVTADGQYLFGNTQPGRRPDCAFYIPPEGYRLGKGQRTFDREIGLKLFDVIQRYLTSCRVLILEGIQGEAEYKTGLRMVISLENPHTAYIAWFGKLMIYPPEDGMDIHCWNYIVQERLPEDVVEEIHSFWPEFDPDEPLTLYDLTRMDEDHRRVMSLRVDYFGGAFKKPNLTMVWNRGEAQGLVSYHAGCTETRVLKGLSGTGKTTLTVGPHLHQDDACLGLLLTNSSDRVEKVQVIGLEAASYAKSEGLTSTSPEWPGLMKSRKKHPDGTREVVLAQNIDCEGIEYKIEEIKGHPVRVPRLISGERIGSLQCTRYEKAGTTNGRFIFRFDALNPDWQPGTDKWLKTEMLSFRRFDIFQPLIRITDPAMAVALDSGCETIITSAIGGKIPGTRVRSYAATDFMAREQAHQALLKLKVYSDMGLGQYTASKIEGGNLVFAIVNSGYVGEHNFEGKQRRRLDEKGHDIPKIDKATGKPALDGQGKPVYYGLGDKIRVEDTKRLVDLVENHRIKTWIPHPVFGEGYLLPSPAELEKDHGMKGYAERFNPLKYYSAEEYLELCKRDIRERTRHLSDLFSGQQGKEKLEDVIRVWERCKLPTPDEIRQFYKRHYE